MKCVKCGKFVAYKTMDWGTPYGSKYSDNPEPLDDVYWCKGCAQKEYKQGLKEGIKMYLYWQIPNWQYKVMRKLNLTVKNYRLVSLSQDIEKKEDK